jgi:hypothetical protein
MAVPDGPMRLPSLAALHGQGSASPANHAFAPNSPLTPVYLPPLTPRTPSGLSVRPSMMGPSRSYGPPSTQYPMSADEARKRTASAMETEDQPNGFVEGFLIQ